MTEARVKDYPELRRRGAGVVNINTDDYQRALARLKQSRRLDNLEAQVQDMSQKMDLILQLLVKGQSNEDINRADAR